MRRREFIRLLGGIAAIPLTAHAQQGERIRRVAVFSSAATDTSDPEGQANLAAFLQAMQQLGWISGQNLRIEQRVGANNAERMRKQAAELATLAPDVIVSAGASSMTHLRSVGGNTISTVSAHCPVVRLPLVIPCQLDQLW